MSSQGNDGDWLDGYAVVGTITKPWGIRGDVKVNPETSDLERFRSLGRVFLGRPETREILEAKVTEGSMAGGGWVLHFEGYESPEASGQLRNALVMVPELERPPLEEGHFYFSDLQGLRVEDEHGTEVGRVVEVIETPTANVFAVTIRGKQVMAPWIDDCVESVDLVRGSIRVKLEYLVDVYPFLLGMVPEGIRPISDLVPGSENGEAAPL